MCIRDRFITFKSGEWIIAEKHNCTNTAHAPKKESICELSGKKYLCYETEKVEFASQLKELEKELILAKDLGF